jgi:secondary thiamine-phosphate synthase enzyme
MVFLKNYFVNTTSEIDFLQVTSDVRYAIRDSSAKNGLVTVFVPGPGAAVSVFEPLDEVKDDLKASFAALAEGEKKGKDKYKQDVDAAPRVLAALVGRSAAVPFKDAKLVMAPYDEIFLIDLEKKAGRREFVVQVIGEDAPAQGQQPPQRGAPQQRRK